MESPGNVHVEYHELIIYDSCFHRVTDILRFSEMSVSIVRTFQVPSFRASLFSSFRAGIFSFFLLLPGALDVQ